jgi:hypothetical protein
MKLGILLTVLTSLFTGGVAGACTAAWLNHRLAKSKIKQLSEKLTIVVERKAPDSATMSVRVQNNDIYPITNAWAYISLNYKMDADIVEPPTNVCAFINPSHRHPLQEDRLCWAVTTPEENPPSVDIYAGESQKLDICEIDPAGKWIQIPSEKGWGTRRTEDKKTCSRVFLKKQKYEGYIRIVSKDTTSRKFDITLDPNDSSFPLKLQN